MKPHMTNEAKTGALILASALALIALLLKVGNFTMFQHGYTVQSRFHYTAGVKKHAPVRLSGVDVGEVKDIGMIYGDETMIELTLWIKDGVKIRLDSEAYVTTLGLMGEKYIEIKAGSPQAPYAKDGDDIPGRDPVRLEELVELGAKAVGDIGSMAKDISALSRRVDSAVVDNRPKIDSIFTNLDETSQNFNDFSQDIKYHPWKVLFKGKEKTPDDVRKDKEKRRAAKAEASD